MPKLHNFGGNLIWRFLPNSPNFLPAKISSLKVGGEIITEFIALRPKTYSYLTDNDKIDKKAKGTKACIIKKMI